MYRYINASDGTLCIYVFMHFLHKYEHLCTKNLCIYVFGIAPFLHDHQSITIKGVSSNDFNTTQSTQPIPELQHFATLKATLQSNKAAVEAIHDNFDNKSITISTTAQHAQEMTEWLDP